MERIFRTPQEKKKLSYEKDCRNDYGENSKASIKGIQKRKRDVNKSYRRSINQTIQNSNNSVSEILEDEIKNVKRKFWKKYPDTPLGKYLKKKRKN